MCFIAIAPADALLPLHLVMPYSPCACCCPLVMRIAFAQEAALQQAASMKEALLRSEAESAAQLAGESARRAQAEEAVEQYIAAHYASQAAAQVRNPRVV